MELERLQAVLRVRGPAEAIDLGFAMLRRWSGPALQAWALGVLPPVLLICGALHAHPLWAALLLAWLAPVFERVPLFVLSRSLFGAPPPPRALLRALPGLLLRGLPRDLLLLRLSPLRAVLAPVALLEGLRGAALSRRRGQLGRTEWLGGLALMAFCGLVELSATIGLLAVLWSFLPDSPLYDPAMIFEEEVPTPPWLGAASLAAYATASSFVQQLRAAGGFGLYISRRTAAEGWDVELQLRRLAARAAALGPLVALALLLAGAPARAQEPAPPAEPSGAMDGELPTEPPPELPADPADWDNPLGLPVTEPPPLDPPDQDLREADLPLMPPTEAVDADLDAVLAKPEVAGVETEARYQLREAFDLGWEWPFDEQEREPLDLDLGPLGALLGQALQLVLAVLLSVALLAALRLLWRARGPRARRASAEAAAAQLEVLPAGAAPPPIDRLGAEALRLLEAGQPEAALALLYRGAVALLVEGGLPIDDSATEGEALRAARGALPAPELTLMRALTRAWQGVAYAHQPVDVAQLRQLCAQIGALRAWAQRPRNAEAA